MSTIAELERELDDARKEVEHKADRRKHWRTVADNKATAIKDRIGNVEEAREDRDHDRDRLVVVRKRLDVIEADGISSDETERFNRLMVKQDSLADEVEDLTALVHRELARIDELDKQRDHAKLLKREFAHDYEAAIARKKRVAEQLADARRNQGGALGTPYFVVAEFACHDGTPVPPASIPALKVHVHTYLLPLRAAHGTVWINSAFRTLVYNASIGGASMSVHVYNANWQHAPWAVAVDHRSAGLTPFQVYAWHEANTHPDGMGKYSSFCHADNRNRIGWAHARWVGP